MQKVGTPLDDDDLHSLISLYQMITQVCVCLLVYQYCTGVYCCCILNVALSLAWRKCQQRQGESSEGSFLSLWS